MLLNAYEQKSLLFNSNFTEQAGNGMTAYRGELVLIEGDPADAQGRRKPPKAVMLGAVLLEKDEKLIMTIGLLNDIALLPALLEMYQGDFADDMASMLFVRNIADPMQVTAGSLTLTLMPLDEGIPWNETIDELALEKSDFKGQSAGEKVATLFNELKGFRAKGDTVSVDEAVARAIEVQASARGPV